MTTNVYETTSTSDLLSRQERIITQVEKLTIEIGGKLQQVVNLRRELELVIQVLAERDHDILSTSTVATDAEQVP